MSDHETPESAATNPSDEINAAFVAIADNAPPTWLSLQSVTNEVEQQRGRRRNWLVGAAAALAGVAVLTTVIVTGGSGSNNTAASSTATSSAAAASSSSSAPVAGALAEATETSSASTDQSQTVAADSGGTGAAPVPNAAASSAASEFAAEQSSEAGAEPVPPPPAATVQSLPPIPADTEPVAPDPTCTGIPLSDQQIGLVTGTLAGVAPVAMTPDGCDLADDLTAVANFAGTEGALLTVEVRQPALPPCDGCTAVSDNIDSLVYGDNSQFTRIFAESGDSTLVLIASPAAGGTAAPFTVDQLVDVAEALLPTI